MKYGMRERLSGAVILLALAVIFLPMLFDEPVPRDERPQPMMSIEAPLEVEREPVAEPEPPVRLATDEAASETVPQRETGEGDAVDDVVADAPDANETDVTETELAAADAASQAEPDTDSDVGRDDPPAEQAPASDPIAELARAADAKRDGAEAQGAAAKGNWSVQAGSFGKPANAERLEQQLEAQGFTAYRRARDNDLTTVYVGPYASAEAGERARSELKAKANIQGLLVRQSP